MTTETGTVYEIDFAHCVSDFYVSPTDEGTVVIAKDEFSEETQKELDLLIMVYNAAKTKLITST